MMRSVNILLCGLVLALVGGCANGRRDVAISAPPTQEELPELTEIQRTLPAVIISENPENASRVRLAPEFVEPELTEEERIALGETASEFKFLPYADRREPPGSTVGSFYAGVATFSSGYGGTAAAVYDRSQIWGVAGWGGAGVGTDSFGSRVSASGRTNHKSIMTGPRITIDVHTDSTDSKVAGRKPAIGL